MELQIFENAEFGSVRAIDVNGEPYFVGKDIAEALGYAVPHKAIYDHCKGVLKRNTPTNSGVQEMSFIPESDVYRLIFRSKLPSAEKFETWVVGEVLPSIRKHGAYMNEETLEKALTSPDFLIKLATELKQEKQKRLEAEQQIERDRPLVIFGGAVSCSDTCILVGELAKLLRQNGIEIGQQRLFKWLRDNGYLMKSGTSKNMPTQRAMEMGLFTIKEGSYVDSNGVNVITKTPKVTGKGQIYFLNKFLSMKDKPLEKKGAE